MNKLIIIFTLFYFAPILTFGQLPKDYFNKQVLTVQGATTNKIIKYLELDSIDKALSYFSKDIDKSTLVNASKNIRKIKNKTIGAYVIVYDEGLNIFRYRYSHKELFFLIDLYFKEGDPNSKVVKVITKDKETLDKEEKERLNDDEIPPPPPKLE